MFFEGFGFDFKAVLSSDSVLKHLIMLPVFLSCSSFSALHLPEVIYYWIYPVQFVLTVALKVKLVIFV